MSARAIAVREARLDEVDGVRAGYEWLFAPPGSQPPSWDPGAAAERIRETIESDRSTVLVAVSGAEAEGGGARTGEGGERIVGICTAYLDLLSVRYGLRCWIEDLAVDPAFRSRGAGGELLAAALGFARSRGATHLELDSGDARTDAHRFYEREGANVLTRCFGWHELGEG